MSIVQRKTFDALNPKRQKIFRKEFMQQEKYCLVGEVLDVQTE